MRAGRSLALLSIAAVLPLVVAQVESVPVKADRPASRAVHARQAAYVRAPVLRNPTPAPVHLPHPGLVKTLLAAINRDRMTRGSAPLKLDVRQSDCSVRHARHMAEQGVLSHDQFPDDVCIRHHVVGENAGMWGGNPTDALLAIHHAMMDEGPCPASGCAGAAHFHAHYLNLVNPTYRRVGIGVVISRGVTWLTEDFTD